MLNTNLEGNPLKYKMFFDENHCTRVKYLTNIFWIVTLRNHFIILYYTNRILNGIILNKV